MDQPPRPDDELTRVHAEPETANSAEAVERTGAGRRAAVIALASIIGLAGIAAAASFSSLRGSGETLTDAIPADTDVVVTAYLDPAASQKVNLFRLTKAFPSLGGEQQMGERVGEWVDEALSDTGLSREDLGWIGSQVAVTVDLDPEATPGVVVVADVDDEVAAERAMDTLRSGSGSKWRSRDVDGLTIWVTEGGGEPAAMVLTGDLFVMGNDVAAVTRVLATSSGLEPSLADDATYQETVAELPQARLGLVYVNPASLFDQLRSVSAMAPSATVPELAGASLDATRGLAMSLTAEPGGFAIDTYASIDIDELSEEQRAAVEGSGDNELVHLVPGDAVALMAASNIDIGIRQALDQAAAGGGIDPATGFGIEGVLSTLTGDMVVEMSIDTRRGRPEPGGAILIGTTDEAAMSGALQILTGVLSSGMFGSSGKDVGLPLPTWSSEEYQGVEITALEGPPGGMAPAFAVFNGAAVVGTSKNAVMDVIDTAQGGPAISDSETFAAASSSVPTGDGLVFIDLSAIAATAELMSPTDAGDVTALEYFVAGADSDLASQRGRAFLSIHAG